MSKSIVVPGSTQSLYEHSPGQFKPYPPVASGLYSVAATPPVFEGAFLVPDSGNGANVEGLTYVGVTCKIAQGTTSNRMFVTGNDNGTGGAPYFAEVQIPAIVNTTNVNSLNLATFVQNYRDIEADMPIDMATPVIEGMSYDSVTGRLFVGSRIYYDATGAGTLNLGYYSDATNLATSAKNGFYAIGQAARAGGQLIPIPPAWQSTFGGTHFSSSGVGGSIISRSSVGPSLHVVNAASIGTNSIIATVMNFPHGDGTMLCGNIADLRTAQIWNMLSTVGGGFCIPGTDTIMFVGFNWDTRVTPDNTQVYYKNDMTPWGIAGYDDTGTFIDGYFPYRHTAFAGYYWLFDLNQIALTLSDPTGYPPHSHRPYEHGYLPSIPYVAWNRAISGAYLNSSNKLICAVSGAASPRFPFGTPAFIQLNLGI